MPPSSPVPATTTSIPSPSPPDGTLHFTSFTTRGQLSAAGDVTITVNDNLGQQFVFTEKKNQDFSPIGVEAVGGSGEFITSVTIFTDLAGGFNEIKQQTFGFQNTDTIAPVPEASTWAMMLLGFVGIGAVGMRKKMGSFRAAVPREVNGMPS